MIRVARGFDLNERPRRDVSRALSCPSQDPLTPTKLLGSGSILPRGITRSVLIRGRGFDH